MEIISIVKQIDRRLGEPQPALSGPASKPVFARLTGYVAPPTESLRFDVHTKAILATAPDVRPLLNVQV